MSKRGQIALYFIIGIIILAIFILGYFFKDSILNNSKENQITDTQNIPLLIQPINNFILSCIEKIGKDSLVLIGEHGGYYDLKKINKNPNNISYYLINNNLIIPSKKTIENSLSLYINNNLKSCTKEFTDFKKDFVIKEGKIETKTTILDEKVNFNIKYDVEIKKETQNYNLNSFNVDINNNLFKIYDSIVMSLNNHTNYSLICISCLNDARILNNLTIEVYNPSEKEGEYVFIDGKYSINNQPYKFKTALRFT